MGGGVEGGAEGEELRKQHERAGASLLKHARTLRDGLLKLPAVQSGALTPLGERLLGECGQLVQAAALCCTDPSNRSAADRAAFDVYSTLSALRREAAVSRTAAASPTAAATAVADDKKDERDRKRRDEEDRKKSEAAAKQQEELARREQEQAKKQQLAALRSTADDAPLPQCQIQAAKLLDALGASVRERDYDRYKDLEKETAIQLSHIIRYLKVRVILDFVAFLIFIFFCFKAQPDGKPQADILFQQTQNVVSVGRIAVREKDRLQDFREASTRLLDLVNAVTPVTRPQPPAATPIAAPPSFAPASVPANTNAYVAPPSPRNGSGGLSGPSVSSPNGAVPNKPSTPVMVSSPAIGTEKAGVQLVGARKTNAAEELMRQYGIDVQKGVLAPTSAPAAPPSSSGGTLGKKSSIRELKELKKKEKEEARKAKTAAKADNSKNKRTLFGRKKKPPVELTEPDDDGSVVVDKQKVEQELAVAFAMATKAKQERELQEKGAVNRTPSQNDLARAQAEEAAAIERRKKEELEQALREEAELAKKRAEDEAKLREPASPVLATIVVEDEEELRVEVDGPDSSQEEDDNEQPQKPVRTDSLQEKLAAAEAKRKAFEEENLAERTHSMHEVSRELELMAVAALAQEQEEKDERERAAKQAAEEEEARRRAAEEEERRKVLVQQALLDEEERKRQAHLQKLKEEKMELQRIREAEAARLLEQKELLRLERERMEAEVQRLQSEREVKERERASQRQRAREEEAAQQRAAQEAEEAAAELRRKQEEAKRQEAIARERQVLEDIERRKRAREDEERRKEQARLAEMLQREEEERVRQEEEERQIALELEQRKQEEMLQQKALEQELKVAEEIRERAMEEERRRQEELHAFEVQAEEKRKREEAILEQQRQQHALEEQRKLAEEEKRRQEQRAREQAAEEERKKREQAELKKQQEEAERKRLLEEEMKAAALKQKELTALRTSQAASGAGSRRASVVMRKGTKAGCVIVRLCEDCGEEGGEDPYCDQCSGKIVEVEVEAKSVALLQETKKKTRSVTKICAECGEEGEDEFCTECGGDLIDVSDGDDGDSAGDEHEDEDAAAADTAAQAYKLVALKERDYDANEDEVFIVDIGTDTIKFGWHKDAEPTMIANVDVKSAASTKRALAPVFNARSADCVAENEKLAELLTFVLKLGGYKRNKNALLVCSSFPSDCETSSDLLDAIFEPRFTPKPPSAAFLGFAPALAAYGVLRSTIPTALVVDIGHSVLQIVPVLAGYSVPHAMIRVPFGGEDMLRFLADLVGGDYNLSVAQHVRRLRDVLAKGCRVAADFPAAMAEQGFVEAPGDGKPLHGWKAQRKVEPKVVDGVPIGVGSVAVAELLFRPTLWKDSVMEKLLRPLPELCQAALAAVAPEVAQQMQQCVVLTGGGSQMAGLAERLTAELARLGCQATVRVASVQGAWKGAQVLAGNELFKRHCTTPEEAENIWSKWKFFQ